MTHNPSPETAKIIPFPIKTRQFLESPASTPHGAAVKKPPVQWGGSWYHQSAIDEAGRDRKS